MGDSFSRSFNPFAEAAAGNEQTGTREGAQAAVHAAALPGIRADRLCENDPMVSGIVHWSWEIPTNVVLYSREWRHILLRPDDETVQTTISSWWPLVHDDDVKSFLEASRDITEGLAENYQTLFRVKRADGKWAWLLSRGRVVEKEGDRPLLVRGTLVDISFLRTDVKFLHGNADMSYPHRHVVPRQERGAGGNAKTAPPSSFESAKNSATLHCPPGIQVVSRPDADMFPADMECVGAKQSALVQACIDRVFAEGRALRETMSFATDYGHNVAGDYYFWPEFDAGGKVIAVTTQFWDLTDKLLDERRARLNEMRLEALHRLTQMSSTPEDEVLSFVIESLVSLTGSAGGFLYFPDLQPGSHSRMVWSQAHYAALDAAMLPVDRLPRELENVTTDDSGRPYQRIIRNGNCLQPVWSLFDGKITVVRYIAAPVFDEGRVVCIAGVRDKAGTEYLEGDLVQLESFVYSAWLVLRRHEYVRELQRAKEAAERANKVKDEFLANISHELRTPLNGMLGMLQLLDFLSLTEQQREYVRTASVSGRALLRIISDILDFSRIESGKMRLQAEPFDFKSAVESSLSLFRQEAEERRLSFEVDVDERIPRTLLGDDARLRQILFNIVGNALKFTERGGIRVECSLLPPGGNDHVWVYIAVRDTGVGIPSGEHTRIFEAFTQIDSSTTRQYAGTGLGLSIVRHLVALMGGGMALESEVGGGTTMHSSLRFTRMPDAAPEPETAKTLGGETRPLQILVAEDDVVSRYAIQKFLQRLGHTAVCAPNGRLALEMLQLYPFDCLFTDIQMPDMDGLEVVRRIRESDFADITPTGEAREQLRSAIPGGYDAVLSVPGDIVTVTVSAHTMRGDKERFLEGGMDFFIAKPVFLKELAEVLDKVSAKIARRDEAV